MNFLVNNVKDSLNGYLVGELYKVSSTLWRILYRIQPDDIGTLLTESVLIAEQRSEFQTMLESYDKASKLLTEVRDSPDGIWWLWVSNKNPHFLLEIFIPSFCLALFHRLTGLKQIYRSSRFSNLFKKGSFFTDWNINTCHLLQTIFNVKNISSQDWSIF